MTVLAMLHGKGQWSSDLDIQGNKLACHLAKMSSQYSVTVFLLLAKSSGKQ